MVSQWDTPRGAIPASRRFVFLGPEIKRRCILRANGGPIGAIIVSTGRTDRRRTGRTLFAVSCTAGISFPPQRFKDSGLDHGVRYGQVRPVSARINISVTVQSDKSTFGRQSTSGGQVYIQARKDASI